MRIYFGGAEAPTLRRRLVNADADHFSVSFWHLRDRLPKDGSFPFDKRFPEDSKILLDSGGFTANKRREEFDGDYWVDYLDSYIELVFANVDALTLITEFDLLDYTVEDLWALRYDVWSNLPEEKFLPVWHPEHGFDELNALASTYPHVALPGEAIKEMGQRLPAVSNRTGTKFHGLAVNSEELIVRSGLHSVSSTAWTSPTRYGDRVLWEHGKLHRFSKKTAPKMVDRYRNLLEREGFDLELLEEEDPDELTRLTIWSLTSWAEHLSRGGVFTPSTVEPEAPNAEQGPQEVATSKDRGGTATEVVPREEGKRVLPVVGFQQTQVTNDSGEVVEAGPAEMHTRVSSARQCNTCYIRHACPEFKPNSDCAFDIPVEIKTKEQLTAMLTGMLEIQTQRALFARFAEELEGGYPTEKVSAEFDRLMEMTKKTRDIQDNRDFLRIQVEGRGQAGVLSRLFGEQASQPTRELSNPMDSEETDRLMAEVVEAEMVEE